MKKNKDKRGGAGRGQGRNKKYGEDTILVSFRCPSSKTKDLRQFVNLKLAEWEQESAASLQLKGEN